MSFRDELKVLINTYSKEDRSATPDFALASFIEDSLTTFDSAVVLREEWYGRFPVSEPDSFTVAGFIG